MHPAQVERRQQRESVGLKMATGTHNRVHVEVPHLGQHADFETLALEDLGAAPGLLRLALECPKRASWLHRDSSGSRRRRAHGDAGRIGKRDEARPQPPATYFPSPRPATR